MCRLHAFTQILVTAEASVASGAPAHSSREVDLRLGALRTRLVTTQWFFPSGRARSNPSCSNMERVPLRRNDAETDTSSTTPCGYLSTVPPPRRAISRSAPCSAAAATPQAATVLGNHHIDERQPTVGPRQDPIDHGEGDQAHGHGLQRTHGAEFNRHYPTAQRFEMATPGQKRLRSASVVGFTAPSAGYGPVP